MSSEDAKAELRALPDATVTLPGWELMGLAMAGHDTLRAPTRRMDADARAGMAHACALACRAVLVADGKPYGAQAAAAHLLAEGASTLTEAIALQARLVAEGVPL